MHMSLMSVCLSSGNEDVPDVNLTVPSDLAAFSSGNVISSTPIEDEDEKNQVTGAADADIWTSNDTSPQRSGRKRRCVRLRSQSTSERDDHDDDDDGVLGQSAQEKSVLGEETCTDFDGLFHIYSLIYL